MPATHSTTLLPGLLDRLADYRRLRQAVTQGKSPLALSGLAAVHRTHFAAALRQDTKRPLVLVCPDDAEARRAAGDLGAFLGEEVPVLTARDFLFHPGAASRQWEQQRLAILTQLTRGTCPLLVATVEGLLQRTLPQETLTQACRQLQVGQVCQLDDLTDFLVRAGYTRCDQVEGPGQFALRGGILDVFSPGLDLPLRMEFWGDEIDSMGLFDPVTQRRTAQRETCELLPAGEVISLSGDPISGPPDLALPQVYPQVATAADYLPSNALVALCDTPRVADRAKNYLWQLGEDITALLEQGILTGKHPVFAETWEGLCAALAKRTLLYFDSFTTGSLPVPPAFLLSLTARQLPGYGISFEAVTEDLRAYQKSDFSVVVLTSSRRKADALQAMLREQKVYTAVDELLHELPEPGRITLAVGGLSAGFDYPDGKLAVLSEGEALPARKPRPKRAKGNATTRQKLEAFTDLSPGDLVVHDHHGIGRFVGMVKMSVDGAPRDYIKLQFAGADILYVPALQLDLVSKYIGSGDDPSRKRLSKLGGTEWEKSKSRAKKAAKDMAKGLIQLYAQRQRLAGHAFAPDSPWQQEFEALFPYPETDDQLRCAQEIKRDMEKPVPMDRLLCGDVGFGKTEVAFRGVMKCLLSGKQAAILVPTTVLARQHYFSAVERFSGYPVKIAMMSRFRTKQQLEQTARQVHNGQIDLLIGTHRILQKDVKFKDLGLLVIDEEQRFGVQHKERIKQMACGIDVLTLTATPIPRTLNMALSGIRDMSVLEEAPLGRQPVQTYVLEHSDAILRDAIRRELSRGGQVYYLHNRIEDIDQVASRLQKEFPDTPIAVAHGRMGEEQMGDVMTRMYQGDIGILVCTTIVETGVDIPNVNTLIIEDADRMGLAQLHQIRGRVGRSSRHAYAYLTYRRGKVLSEIAQKRLSAIREFAEFGSGFKIAMRDLEIRGAGSVLGAEQSGHMMDVGYDMYLQLLEEAAAELRGETPVRRTECTADLLVSAGLPQSYVPDAATRVELYRRIAMISSREDFRDMQDELIDRFGDLPRAAQTLLDIALLRADASKAGISEITQKNGALLFFFRPEGLEGAARACAAGRYKGRIFLSAGEKPYVTLKLRPTDDPLALAREVTDLYTGEKA